jgi:N-acetylated-alpha-linked acidic dipeptidase
MTTKVTSVPRERDVVDAVRVDDAWRLVEEFSTLVRESGTDEEREAVAHITRRLDAWGVSYAVHEPELLISLPRGASLAVDGVEIRAKTPSMAVPTPDGGLTAPIVYEASGHAKSVNDIFTATHGDMDVAGKIVVTEGFPMPGRITDLESRGAVGVVAVAPGRFIHEGICTPIWGSPDLTTWSRQPTMPVVSIAREDGDRLIARIAEGDVEATMVAQLDTRWRRIPVVVAEIRGQVEPERFVLAHGHIDSWHVGVGDNATGDATLLELARVLHEHRDALARTVRVAWWSGHSHGRYAGSTWFADEFALDLERNCVCHVNCDSPGCRDADVFEDVYWMAEVEGFAKDAIQDFTGLPGSGRQPLRAGDISFNNLGLSTFFMLTSTMTPELRAEKGYYAVGGCGGNIEWHTEEDTLEIADRDNLLRDIRLYVGAAFRAANTAVHPLDFRATVAQIEATLREQPPALGEFVDLRPTFARLEALGEALDELYATAAAADSVQAARAVNDALLRMGRALVRVLYSSAGPYRQDPALHIPLLPDFGHAAEALGTVPDGVVRTEVRRARNRLDGALAEATDLARSVA